MTKAIDAAQLDLFEQPLRSSAATATTRPPDWAPHRRLEADDLGQVDLACVVKVLRQGWDVPAVVLSEFGLKPGKKGYDAAAQRVADAVQLWREQP